MGKKVDKYIDFNQFPKNNKGYISWSNSVGLTVEFYYYGEKHFLTILDYGNPDKDYVLIRVDDMPPEIVNTQKIRNLSFNSLFFKPNYIYNIGDIVNGMKIMEQLHMKEYGKGTKKKHYKCKCVMDGYECILMEEALKKGRKCPMCVGKVLIVGHNDIATTDPDIVELLLDKEDGYRYTRCSHKYVWVVCQICGHKKYVRIEDLILNQGFSCPRCSDGLSYPNKFAYNVFEQIGDQYEKYIPEYSPDWAGRMRYDNYILLKDGTEIVIEMDGGFHYNDYGVRSAKNDVIKDSLAKEHGIDVIRVNCFYTKITQRFDIVRNGFIKAVSKYFNLSDIDWKSANEAGISNRLIDVVNYYNEHPFASNQQIADHFHIGVVTIRHYLMMGESLGLCTYVRHDPNRYKTSSPLMLYDSEQNIVGVFISARHMSEVMKDKGFHASSIRAAVNREENYKGYVIKKITWEEYEQYEQSS